MYKKIPKCLNIKKKKENIKTTQVNHSEWMYVTTQVNHSEWMYVTTQVNHSEWMYVETNIFMKEITEKLLLKHKNMVSRISCPREPF
jgi:hypothetical protein